MAPRGRSAKRHKFDPESVQKALVNTIIINELPFSVVEQDKVKEIIQTSFPGFHIPSSETISRVHTQLFMDEKLKLKRFIKATKQRVCLSLDTWMSKQSVNYLCITAHFIDDNWNLHKKVIGFSPICSDNGEEIGKAVEKCLNDWGINNVLAVSAGDASSYDAAVSYLGPILADPVLDGKFLRLKCLVELTNTLIKKVLKDYEEAIARVRAAIRHVLQSPGRIRKFKRSTKEYAREYVSRGFTGEYGVLSKSFFSLDCPSKWTTTFEMLKSAENFEVVFDSFGNEDPSYIYELANTCGIPVHEDWEKVRNVVYFLHLFKWSKENILGSRVTSSIFLSELDSIDYHLHNWTMSFRGDKKRFFKAQDLKMDYFFPYWGQEVEDSNMLIYIASILDPRHRHGRMERYFQNIKYKNDYTDEGEPLWKKKAEWVFGAFYDLFNEYAVKITPPQQTANLQTSGYMVYLYHDSSPRREAGSEDGYLEHVTEIDAYLIQDFEAYDDGFDVLVWWKVNSERYPVLSRMAKDVLAIPISAVPLESDINVDGNLLDDFKSSLSPSMAEALVCTQDWIKKSKKQVKVKDGSTKLADKILKGIYEQLKGAASGRG